MNKAVESYELNRQFFHKRLKKKGKSQAHLAEKLGISAPQVSQMLRGKRRIYAQEIKPIADYLECSVLQVLGAILNEDFTELEYHAELMRTSIIEAEKLLAEQNITLSVEKKALLFTYLYEAYVLSAGEEEEANVSPHTANLLLKALKDS